VRQEGWPGMPAGKTYTPDERNLLTVTK
jgi:hypothetical protein